MPRQLEVWLSDAHIGTLAQIDGRLGFSYAADWLAHASAVPLSQSLPLQANTFNDRAARPFFAGLLPDGDQRKRVAQLLCVSRQNEAGLSPAQTKKPILHIAKRLPTLSQMQWDAWQAQGQSHPILGHIVALVEQRCCLTIRRLTLSDSVASFRPQPR